MKFLKTINKMSPIEEELFLNITDAFTEELMDFYVILFDNIILERYE